jgi:GrpB-like predicted nucleotidyltransferase (UPF0157 family)
MGMRVEIVSYDSTWPQRFALLARQLRDALGVTARRVDHIGSTAVPGLDAKPVIDIQVSVDNLEPVENYSLVLARLGYVFRPDNPDLTKRYFRERPGEERTHIHVRQHGSWSEQFALLFRDYLRAHGDEARRYAELKYTLAAEYGENREGYTEAKGPFIWDLMRAADRWSQVVGWRPGASDG